MIPNLMPFQLEPFNGDSFIEQEFLKLRDKFNIKVAVELGTCLGSTAIWLSENFDTVHTVEINPEWAAIAAERMGDRPNTTLYVKNSLHALPIILPEITNETIFFIDSHWGPCNPLLRELELIKKHGIKPIIVIHDMKVPDHPELSYDQYAEEKIVYEWKWIKDHVSAIYDGKFEHYYNSEATGAKVGCLFVVPA